MELFSLQLILLLCNLLICGVSSLDTQNNVNDLDPNIDPTLLKMNDDEIEATYGELNMGMDLFEGDIKLTESQRKFVESSRSVGNIQTRALISDPSKLWNGGKVPYEIDSSLSEESVNYVNEAIDEWQSRTCVTFHEKTDGDEDYIQFVYEQGCSSYVGRIGGHQTISVGNEDQSIVCKKGNIIHEIAHALGFFHEHSRPDRDDYVDVLWNNVVSGYEKNFYKETTETVNSRGVGYDYGSVMHYGEFFFTKQRGSRTLVPKTSGVSIGQRIGLSDLDVQQARILYQCDESRDQPSKNNRTSLRGKSEKELWTRPLREHEVKVLRKSKVQSHKHKNQEDKHKKYETKARPIKKKDSSSKDTKKKSLLKKILKNKMASQKSHASDPISAPTTIKNFDHQKHPRSSKSVKKTEIKPITKQFYSGDPADILEGDDDEDAISYSRAVNSAPAVAPETPNQLATDRATLAQEKEDAVQQQDNEDIGEENLGKDYFEGDMILTPKQQAYLDNIKTNGAPTQEGTKRGLIRDTMYLWPKAKVYFDFDKGVDRIGRRRARAAMRHWQKHTCLKFKRVRNDPDNLGFIKFVFEGGCASRVGRGGNKMQKLTIGSPSLRCKVGNIIHELGHAVGFFHEHSRPDRNKYVRVLKKNILPGYERNFFRFGRKWIDSRGVPYDYGSIMHYNKAFFSRFPVMLDTLLPLREVEIGQRKALSRFDILQANLLYKCDGRKRLTDEEIEELKEEVENEMEDQSYEAFCADVYDQNSCQEIKSRGYCQKFPRSMRTTCGITCNLCVLKTKNNSTAMIQEAGR
ncbi:uncharacterized protein LOC141871253 [Acropora palmata]|uniref:uncharacterized protein LOC141871253 n=1 Tax=Acropora palmata TaxID=6131 RepID=UPI003DA02B89